MDLSELTGGKYTTKLIAIDENGKQAGEIEVCINSLYGGDLNSFNGSVVKRVSPIDK